MCGRESDVWKWNYYVNVSWKYFKLPCYLKGRSVLPVSFSDLQPVFIFTIWKIFFQLKYINLNDYTDEGIFAQKTVVYDNLNLYCTVKVLFNKNGNKIQLAPY